MEKVIYYSILKNGSVDVIININGHDKGCYHYSSYKSMRREFKDQSYKFIKIISEIER